MNDIIAACQREAEAARQPDPEKDRQLRAALDKLRKTIDFNRRNPGETDEEQSQTEKLLKQLRAERVVLEADLSAVEAAKTRVIVPPTAEEVRQMLTDLHEMLITAATSETDAQLGKARRIIELLTGGRIELFQMGERGRNEAGSRAALRCGCSRFSRSVRPAFRR